MTMYELDKIVQLFVLVSPFHGLMSQFYKEKPRDFRKFIVNHARVSNKFPCFFIFFFGALISLSATADLVANVPIDQLDNSQRRLIASTTASFVCTKAAQTWTVPAGVFKIFVNVTGSQGAGNGGLGGWVQASLSVKGGDLLYISVGCRDGDFNGGGDCGNSYGGGASDIRTSLSDLKTRLVVAGGGGGSSQSRDIAGSGGGLEGEGSYDPDWYGQGGSQSYGGAIVEYAPQNTSVFSFPIIGGFGQGADGIGGMMVLCTLGKV